MSTTAPRLAERNAELEAALAERDAKLAALFELVQELKRENALLKDHVLRLQRARYAPKADRFDKRQLELFAELFEEEPAEETLPEALESPDVELPEDPPSKAARRQKRKARETNYQALPREHRRHELPEAQRICPITGKTLVPVGMKVTEELEYQPARLFVVVHERVEYGLSEEDRAERKAPTLVAPLPARPIDEGLAGPGLLARVLVAKYVDHLPLHRQESIFEREGLRIPRQTLCEWVMRSIELLLPIVLALKRLLQRGSVLQCDDTQVLCTENAKGGGRRLAYLWAWVGESGEEVVYDFSLGRGHEVVENWLGPEWSGYLVGDGYTGYGTVSRKRDPQAPIIEVGCWAHARRKVKEAAENAPEDAVRLGGLIRQLYAVEKEARERELDSDAIRELRRKKSVAVLWRIRSVVREQRQKYAPGEGMSDAVGYITNQWRALRQYVKDGRLPIDNNACERAIRPVAVGRKNWLFTASPRGGALGAAIYSIVETCKRCGVEPFAYLSDVLVRLRTHPVDQIEQLMPGRWKELRDSGELPPLPR